MNVFLSFIAALAISDSRSALMGLNCINTQQNTLLWQQLEERDLERKYIWVPGNKRGPVKWGKNAYNEMLFSFKISFPWFYFFFKPLLIRMNLTVLWNNGDYSKAIKFLKMLFIPVTFTSHPLNTDDRCQRGKSQHKWKDHQKWVSPCAFGYI